jgi:hypothetical protein
MSVQCGKLEFVPPFSGGRRPHEGTVLKVGQKKTKSALSV